MSAVAACCSRASASSPLARESSPLAWESSFVSSWFLRSAEARSSVGEAVMTTRAADTTCPDGSGSPMAPASQRRCGECYAIWRLDGMSLPVVLDPVGWRVPPTVTARRYKSWRWDCGAGRAVKHPDGDTAHLLGRR